MGPPPLPAPSHTTPQHKSKDSQEIVEKYRKLKRRYFDLEEVSPRLPPPHTHTDARQKHKETSSELLRSGERNVKMREDQKHVHPSPPSPAPNPPPPGSS